MDEDVRELIQPYVSVAAGRVRGLPSEGGWAVRILECWKNAVRAILDDCGAKTVKAHLKTADLPEWHTLAGEFELTYELFRSIVYREVFGPSRIPSRRASKRNSKPST